MRAFVCICAAGLVASLTGCTTSQGFMMNASGQSFYNQGNYAQAAQEFQRASFADPYNANYIANLATALKKQGNLPAAEQTYVRALDVNPQHQPSYHGLAQMYLETNRQQDASTLLSQWAAAQAYSPEPQIELAWLNREIGNPQGAMQSLQQALKISPNHPKATAALGQFYQDTGQMQLAANMYQQSLRSDWYQPEIQSRLATLQGYAPEPTLGNSTTQIAQNFGGVPNIRMPFPPAPQFAQNLSNNGANYGATTPRFAQDYLTNPGLIAQGVPHQSFMATRPVMQNQFATAPQIPQVAAVPTPNVAIVAPAPVAPTQVYQPPQPVVPNVAAIPQPTVVPGTVYPTQPADTQYPVTDFGTTQPYTSDAYGADPFANQYISQPNAGVVVAPGTTTVQPGTTGVFQPPPGSVATPGVPFPQPAASIPGVAADPAHVPRVSGVPEMSAF